MAIILRTASFAGAKTATVNYPTPPSEYEFLGGMVTSGTATNWWISGVATSGALDIATVSVAVSGITCDINLAIVDVI